MRRAVWTVGGRCACWRMAVLKPWGKLLSLQGSWGKLLSLARVVGGIKELWGRAGQPGLMRGCGDPRIIS